MLTRTNTTIPTVDQPTNRYHGYLYNEIGAVTSDGSYAFSYDALGQPLSKVYNSDANTKEYYVYTPGDERIGVQRGSWWNWSVRDEGGKVLRQYRSSTTNPTADSLWIEDFVWRDGLLLGSQRPVEMGGPRHFHLDHLGTPRLITADSGQMVSYHDYYPFGDEHSPVGQEGPGVDGFDREEPMKFTGHERDYAGGMGGEDGHAVDYMHARFYSPSVGRFLRVDPVLGRIGNPQSWNRFSYVSNNPMNRSDPTGRLQEDSNGHVIFTKTGTATVTFMQDQPLADGTNRTVTITWRVNTGYVKADNGKKVEATQATSEMAVVIRDAKGNVAKSGGNELLPSGWSNSADCHGTTFAKGQVWINNDQVKAIIAGDHYKNTSTPNIGDVGIYSIGGNLTDTQHSVRVTSLDSYSCTPSTVYSKGGITAPETTSPGPGPNSAWSDPTATLQYYTKDH